MENTTQIGGRSLVPLSNGKFCYCKDLRKVISYEKLDVPAVYNYSKKTSDINHWTASKYITIKTNIGSDIVGSPYTTILVFDKCYGLVEKKLSEVKGDDLVLKYIGYFCDKLKNLDDKKILKSFSYIYGLWYGKGKKQHRGKLCICMSNNEKEITNILKNNIYVDSIVDVDENNTTVYLSKSFNDLSNKFMKRSNSYSIFEMVGLVRGVFDGCGYIYNKKSHKEISLRFQAKDYDFCNNMCTILQSIGINAGKSKVYRHKNGNALSEHINVSIYGKSSYENFRKYIGFLCKSKNNSVDEIINEMKEYEYIPSFFGRIIDENISETFDSNNTDDELFGFLNCSNNLSRVNFINYFGKYANEYKLISMIVDGCYFSTISEILVTFDTSDVFGFQFDGATYMGSCFVSKK